MQLIRHTSWFLVFAFLGCGAPSGNLPSIKGLKSEELKGKPGAPTDKSVTLLQPDNPYYVDQLHYKMHFAKSGIPENHQLIWLNFEGGMVSLDNFTKFGLNCPSQSYLAQSSLSMTDIQDIVTYVRAQFDYNVVEITTDFPETGTTFSTIHVGGDSTQLKCGDELDASSAIAIKDPYNLFSGDIGVVFEDKPNATKSSISRVISHMIDPEDGAVLQQTQIDVDLMHRMSVMARAMDDLRPEDIIDISHLQPQIDAIVPARVGRLPNLDKVITVLVIAGSDSNNNTFDINKAKNTLADVANSDSVNTLSAIAAAAGAPEISLAVELAKLLLGSGSGGSNKAPPPLPPVDEFLELDFSSYAMPEILGEFEDTAQFIQTEHAAHPELIEMLIFGYLQEMPQSSF